MLNVEVRFSNSVHLCFVGFSAQSYAYAILCVSKSPLLHADIVFDVLVHSTRMSCLLLGFTDPQDIKRTLVALSDRTGLTVSQVEDEVLYTGLLEMQELPDLTE